MSEFVNTYETLGDHAVTDGLISRTIEEFADDRVTKVHPHALRGCVVLKKVDFPNAASVGENAFLDCPSLQKVFLATVASIGASAFKECAALEEVQALAPVVIGDSAFHSCGALAKLDAPAVTKIGTASFANCNALKVLELAELTSLGESAFANCLSLSEVGMPVVPSIPANAFKGCVALESVDASVATSIGATAFSGCTKLGFVYAPEVVSLADGSFLNCEALMVADFPVLPSVAQNAFSGCTGLVEVNLPEATTFGNRAFQNCSSLVTLNAPKLQKLVDRALIGCSSLERLDLPVGTGINIAALDGCSSLRIISVRRTDGICNLGGYLPDLFSQGKGWVLVPTALIDSYKAVTMWSHYASCIVSLEANTMDGTVDGALGEHYITGNLIRVTNSNPAVLAGNSYSASLTSDMGTAVQGVVVRMGGEDVTDSVYSEGSIRIPKVTGDIDIEAYSRREETLLHNWDFTESLTDTVSGLTATLARTGSSVALPVQDERGLVLDNASAQYFTLPGLAMTGRSLEIDFAEFNYQGSEDSELRLVTIDYRGWGPLIWRPSAGWAQYTDYSWKAVYGEKVAAGSPDALNYFNGKTVRIEFSAGRIPSLYVNNAYVGETTVSAVSGNGITIGSSKSGSGDGSPYRMVITGIRIYEEVTA